MRKIILLLSFLTASVAFAESERSIQTSQMQAPRAEFSTLNLLVGSIFATLNFGWGDHFSIGPSLGIHPLYLLTPGTSVLSYDVGIDSNIFVLGNRYSNSWFINPYTYYSRFKAYRVEESILHLGFNLGYRWIFKGGLSLAVGAGIQTHYSFMAVYSYNPRGRVSMGDVQNWVPIAPSFKLTLGLPI